MTAYRRSSDVGSECVFVARSLTLEAARIILMCWLLLSGDFLLCLVFVFQEVSFVGSEGGGFFFFLFKASFTALTEFHWKNGENRGFGIMFLSLINWVTFDKIVNSCNNHLLSGMLVVCRAPCWALKDLMLRRGTWSRGQLRRVTGHRAGACQPVCKDREWLSGGGAKSLLVSISSFVN